jgi:molybdate transport system ATP-binding protein
MHKPNVMPSAVAAHNALPGLHAQLSLHAPLRLQVDMHCAPGELLAVVGPSGSGKTSLLRALAGLLPFRGLRGQIRCNNTLWFDSAQHTALPPQQRRVGFMFQHYALFPHLNAIKNIAACAYSTPASGLKPLEIAEQLMQRLGLDGLQQRMPHELSGGQQQRVAFARALAGEPQLLLLDEPFSAVDARTRHQLLRELAALRAKQLPIVWVTHDLHEARRLADRVLVLDAGQGVQCGASAQVFTQPRNARVAEFLGFQTAFKGRLVRSAQTSAASALAQLAWLDVEENRPLAGIESAEAAINSIALQVLDKNKIPHGTAVSWVIADEFLQVQGSAAAHKHNTIACRLHSVLSLGEQSHCELAPLPLRHVRVQATLASAQLRAQGWQVGSTVYLHLPAEGIHILPLRAQSSA